MQSFVIVAAPRRLFRWGLFHSERRHCREHRASSNDEKFVSMLLNGRLRAKARSVVRIAGEGQKCRSGKSTPPLRKANRQIADFATLVGPTSLDMEVAIALYYFSTLPEDIKKNHR
jgi:hypothetical protein